MKLSFEKDQKRRLISSYFSVVISIALVLFLLGILGIIVINAKFISKEFKEKVVLTIYLEDSSKQSEINQLKNNLLLSKFVKTTKFISKESAAEFMKLEYGEDFLDEIGYNPLKNSFEINFMADFVTTKRLDSISNQVIKKRFVEDVKYDKDLVSLVNSNVNRISFWILITCGIFTLIAVLLINSSIRLAVYSKRFSIKTMQMVGATKKFIRKPFILRNILLGIFGSILAVFGNIVFLYYVNISFPELQIMKQLFEITYMFVVLFFIGIFISWLSTYWATQRFLNLKTNELY
ncbi:MAG: cell division protein FtsX [Flavobacteriaceae bacterium]|nr:cell division protein FtsX [Flavobacteriaceae bacterium]